jgi:hypothetical protein
MAVAEARRWWCYRAAERRKERRCTNVREKVSGVEEIYFGSKLG